MRTSWVAIAALGAASLSIAVATDQWDTQADAIVANFTADDIVGQMNLMAIYLLTDASGAISEDAVKPYADIKSGGYFGSPLLTSAISGSNGTTKYLWNASDYREVVSKLQDVAMAANGGHPILYGLDSVHGAGFIQDAVFFPQQINGAASFNPSLVKEMGRVTARDTLAAGVPWVFSPILEVAVNPLWPRTFETFGEDPYTVSVMADAVIRGMQSINGSAACIKHFIAYSKLPTGKDQEGVTLTDYELLNYFAPPFLSAMKAGALSLMENYISINGVPTIENTKILKTLLRDDFGFDGMVVSDFVEIDALQSFHRTARTAAEATKLSLLRTSVDMSMMGYGTSFVEGAKALLEEEPDVYDRLKESARRIIKLKLQLGLYDNPVQGEEYLPLIGNSDDVAAALELARESVVLLQNNNTLPLASSSSVFLSGHSANNISNMCGGWTVTTAGSDSNSPYTHGVTVKDGLAAIGGDSVSYFNGLNVDGSFSDENLVKARELAAKAEYTVVAIGETAYTEKAGDIVDLALPAGQIEYVKELASTGTKVIVVLFEGRPRLLSDLPENVHAIVHGMLACELGGQAVAEVIYGIVNPSGRLPITYPKYSGTILMPYNHRVTTKCGSGNAECEMQWTFGTGLSFTTFEYSDLTLSKTNITSSADTIDVSVVVTNSGSMAGKETVMLFLTQPYRSYEVPEVKMLKKFDKIRLGVGESATVVFTLSQEDWGVYYPQIGQGFKKVAEDTDYVIAIKPETHCDVYNATATALNPLCATFTLNTGDAPFATLQ